MSTDKEIKKEEKELKKEEKVLVKEKKKVEKAIDKDIKKIEKADKKLDTDVGKGKAETVVTKDEIRKLDAQGDLQKHEEEKQIIESKLDNLGNPNAGILGTGHHGNTGTAGVVAVDQALLNSNQATNISTTHTGSTGAVIVDRNAVHSGVQSGNSSYTDRNIVTGGGNTISSSTQTTHSGDTTHIGSGDKVVKVIEHVHPTKREEHVVRHDAPVERRTVVEREVIPHQEVEIHKHVHPVERVDIHEHHKQRETEVVKERVHETHVKEVHEHRDVQTRVDVDKEVVHPERIIETNKVKDLGEVSRDVVDQGVVGHEHKHHHHGH